MIHLCFDIRSGRLSGIKQNHACEVKSIPIADLFSWKSISTDTSNSTCVNFVMIEKDAEYCERSYPKRITVFEYRTNFETSNYMCQAFGGNFFYAKSNIEIEELRSLIKVSLKFIYLIDLPI